MPVKIKNDIQYTPQSYLLPSLVSERTIEEDSSSATRSPTSATRSLLATPVLTKVSTIDSSTAILAVDDSLDSTEEDSTPSLLEFS